MYLNENYENLGDIVLPPFTVLTPKQKADLETLIQAPTNMIFTIMQEYFTDLYHIDTDEDNYALFIPKKNATNVMFVAHIDTVLEVKPNKKLIWESENVLRADNSVLGADDRAGVFVIYEAVKNSERLPYILLTNYEESGGEGVRIFCETKQLPDDVHFMVEFDRQGCGEYVVYSHKTPECVNTMMSKLGYRKEYGSFSDVKVLTEYFEIAHINLSVGYVHQHSIDEYLILPEVLRAIETAKIFINTKFPTPIKVPKPFIPNYKKIYLDDDIRYGQFWTSRNLINTHTPELKECELCGQYSRNWREVEGMILCADCQTMLGYYEENYQENDEDKEEGIWCYDEHLQMWRKDKHTDFEDDCYSKCEISHTTLKK